MKPLRNWQKIVILSVIVLALAGFGFLIYLRTYRTGNQNPTTNYPPTSQDPQSNPSPTPESVLFYPIANYNARDTFRYYGLFVTSAQKASPCGAPFTGFHVGDDLEIFPNEVSSTVPIYAISDSTVRQLGNVSGYGGLIVLDTTINNEIYTIYYGHIDLSSSILKVSDRVMAGQKIANLGAGCSTQTDGERKHLHFAIHKGNTVDVRGYVQTRPELADWINPKEYLQQNKAKTIQ